jgi:hypothetical protein
VTRSLLCGFLGLLAVALTGGAHAAAPQPWVEFGDDGMLSVRTVIAAGTPCPQVTADGGNIAAKKRIGPDDRFPLDLCDAHVAATSAKITVAGKPVPSLPAMVGRIVVIGDTGCRIEGRAAQDCKDPVAWPFRTIAERAAARHPDLVIHVGDYLYRLAACPAGNSGCAGSPHGDNWPTWQADFFDPAAPLLAVAPWVTVRGNHELCRRGGEGWRRLLDPHPGEHTCSDVTAPYRLAVGEISLLMLDSADAEDFKAEPAKVAGYAAQMKALLADPPAHSWLLTHRPVWALAGGSLTGLSVNLTEEAAIRDQVPPGLDLVIAGHLHDFAAYAFGPQRPAQLIVGTGGDTLLDLAEGPIVGAEIDGMPVTAGYGRKSFGYFVLDRAEAGWDGVFYTPDDAVIARCMVRGRDLDCR